MEALHGQLHRVAPAFQSRQPIHGKSGSGSQYQDSCKILNAYLECILAVAGLRGPVTRNGYDMPHSKRPFRGFESQVSAASTDKEAASSSGDNATSSSAQAGLSEITVQ